MVYDIAQEVSWRRFCHILLVKVVTGPCFKGRQHRRHTSVRVEMEKLGPCIHDTVADLGDQAHGQMVSWKTECVSFGTLHQNKALKSAGREGKRLVLAQGHRPVFKS